MSSKNKKLTFWGKCYVQYMKALTDEQDKERMYMHHAVRHRISLTADRWLHSTPYIRYVFTGMSTKILVIENKNVFINFLPTTFVKCIHTVRLADPLTKNKIFRAVSNKNSIFAPGC
jgi:hypothetical protein